MIIQFGYGWKLGRPAFMPVLDCRKHIKGCFSVKAARKHPKYKDLRALAYDIYDTHSLIAVGCDQGQHRSVALARDLAQREHSQETAYLQYQPYTKERIVKGAIQQMSRSLYGAGIGRWEMTNQDPSWASSDWYLGKYKLAKGGSKGKLTNKFSPEQCWLLKTLGRFMINEYLGNPAIPLGTDTVHFGQVSYTNFWSVSHDPDVINKKSWELEHPVEQGVSNQEFIVKGVCNAI